MEEKKGISRRGFLKTAAAVSAALAVNPAYEKVMAATAAGVNIGRHRKMQALHYHFGHRPP